MHKVIVFLPLLILSGAGLSPYVYAVSHSDTAVMKDENIITYSDDNAVIESRDDFTTTLTTPSNKASNTQPKVDFPTDEQVAAYNKKVGSEIITISNSSQGEPNSVRADSKGNKTFVVWLGKIDGINHVFFSVTRDRGFTYTQPVELSPPDGGNASNLQLAVYDSIVDVVWQSTNLTSGISSIIGSVSMDGGSTFKTYQISAEGINGRDPVLPGNFIVIWTQDEEPCGGGDPNIVATQFTAPKTTIDSTAMEGSQGGDGTDSAGDDSDGGRILCARFFW